MIRSIGIRVEPKQVNYVVLDFDESSRRATLVAYGKFSPPKSYDEAESLSWYRTRIIQEIDKHAPVACGIRFPEVFGRKGGMTTSDHRRLRIEGVVLEASGSKGIHIFGGASARITSTIQTESVKAYKSKDELRGVDISALTDQCRDAALVALASAEEASCK